MEHSPADIETGLIRARWLRVLIAETDTQNESER